MTGEEQTKGTFRLAEAFAREFVFLGYLSLIGKDFTGTESKALGKCPPSTHGYGVCFHFRQWLVRYPGREKQGATLQHRVLSGAGVGRSFSSFGCGCFYLMDMGLGGNVPGVHGLDLA